MKLGQVWLLKGFGMHWVYIYIYAMLIVWKRRQRGVELIEELKEGGCSRGRHSKQDKRKKWRKRRKRKREREFYLGF